MTYSFYKNRLTIHCKSQNVISCIREINYEIKISKILIKNNDKITSKIMIKSHQILMIKIIKFNDILIS